jgi:hypothetical protein
MSVNKAMPARLDGELRHASPSVLRAWRALSRKRDIMPQAYHIGRFAVRHRALNPAAGLRHYMSKDAVP